MNTPIPPMLNIGCGRRAHPDWANLDCVASAPGVIVHDARKGLPFSDATFDVVYHSHILEHFRHDEAPAFLRECHRVLRPGGILRVAVPDLEQICRLYLENLSAAEAGDAEASRRYKWIVLELLDQLVRDQSGGEMVAYWRLNPMPAEKFVVERMGSEVLSFRQWWLQQAESRELQAPLRHPTPDEEGQFRQSGEVHRWMYDRRSLAQLLGECGFVKARVCGPTETNINDFNHYLLDVEADGSTRKPDSLFMEATKPAA